MVELTIMKSKTIVASYRIFLDMGILIKWKGITGGGKNWPITKGKSVAPGTSQGCRKATGTYQLPE